MHESRLKILNATLNVVREKGYHATRIEDVCAAAGLTKGSFFKKSILQKWQKELRAKIKVISDNNSGLTTYHFYDTKTDDLIKL